MPTFVPLGGAECAMCVPLGDVECAMCVPLGDVEWHGHETGRVQRSSGAIKKAGDTER